jgi:hypothetical protein
MGIFKSFKNEMTWDGVIAIAAIIGMLGTATVYAVETRSTANDAQKAALEAKVEADKAQLDAVKASEEMEKSQMQQDMQYTAHFDRLDSAIQLLTTIVAERTGKPIPSQDIKIYNDGSPGISTNTDDQ